MRTESSTFFPELKGDERKLADAWLLRYLRLVVLILREHDKPGVEIVHRRELDSCAGTGKVRTPNPDSK